MANSVTVKMTGLHELGERLRKRGDDMGNKIARASTAAGAQVMKKGWRQRAPVAAKAVKERGVVKQPGNYRDNIVTKKVPASQTNMTSEHMVVVRGGRKHGFASHEAALLEFGTVKMGPHASARPTFDADKERAAQAIVDKLTQGINKAESK